MNGYFILFVALAISAVAGYYSIVGLATIFAAAVIPVIIMGTTLEIAKLVTASWLYTNWKNIPFLLKTYFTFAVILLMFITSMGIFGFLSKAHIQKTGESAQYIARLEQIPSEISRIDNTINRTEESIQKLVNKESSSFDTVQQQIDQEQSNIDDVYKRIEPDVNRLQNIIDNSRLKEEKINSQITLVETYITNNQIKELQGLIGVKPDGDFGPNTQIAIETYKMKLEKELELVNPIITETEQKIIELRNSLNPLVQESNDIIKKLRQKLNIEETIDISPQVNTFENEIKSLELEKDKLLEEKFMIEDSIRNLEVEVGPLKYIAEFIYGTADPDILEKSVRWVILIIILVFDPLAVLLVIAANMTIKNKDISKNKSDLKITQKDVYFVSSIDDITKNDSIGDNEKVYDEVPTKTIPQNTRNFKYYNILKSQLTKYKK
jgi:hypothetical protein